jgi:archaellum biogenesis ATPase FlaH
MSKIAEKYGIDLTYDHKTGCPGCIRKGHDNSRNNLQVYASTESAHCFACGWTIASAAHREAMGWDEQEEEEEEVSTRNPITQEENQKIKTYTAPRSKGWRGIKDETNIPYGIRYSYDEETGQPDKMFVPTTMKGELVGYKTRVFPKDFSNPIGVTGKDCDLIGQFRYKTGGKVCLIVGGEVDMVSAEQMLWEYQKSRGHQDYPRTAVVCPSTGEGGSVKQIQAQYEFFNSFEKIIIGLDNDAAGKKAAAAYAAVLPKGKVYVATWSKKDPNEMLQSGVEKTFINDYFRAKPYTPDGIVGSGGLREKIIEQALIPKIPLPPFMHRVQKLMAGGIPLGVIVNLASASGTGKSTIIDECTYYWIFNSPHRIGVITMESDSGQYGTKLLSRHVGRKIDLIESVEEKLAYLDSPEVIAASEELFKMPDGSDRWHLIEDRDGGLESLKELILQLIIQCECKVIIIDPVQDMLEGLNNEEQAKFCSWMKGIIKQYTVTFVNVSHVRKSGSGQKANSIGADMHEEDIHGSSSLIKSAACNLLFSRNKEAEDEIEKNTTFMKATKIRWTGNTGVAGEYYYEKETHTMHDKQDWLSRAGVAFGND